MSIVTCIGFLSLLAAPAAAFWRLPCKSTLVVERADPIVAPGKISAHVHQIMGGNGFDFEMDYADTQASTCTSCTVHGDFSNYWTPVLYYQHQDGSFEKVKQIGGGLIYYLQRPGPNNDKLKAFPEGFRMVSGNPLKRSGGNDFASQAISYVCLDYNGAPKPETAGFPAYNCPNGIRSQVFFPSCWDGVNLDSPDHKSHMAFPIGAFNNGRCPDTHPVHMISLFYEIIWDTNRFKDMWYGNSQPFVWAMGDPTGYGFHGDFLMGWDKNLLQRAIDECTNDSGRVEDCPVFQLYPDSTAEGCKLPSRVNEDIQGPFSALPGCNPVQAGPQQATTYPSCTSNATIGAGKSFFKDLTASGWGYQGCGTDNYYARALTGKSTSSDSMTNEQCIKFCGDAGFSIAGSEYGRECFCANSIPTAAQPVPGVAGNCDMPCAGDSNQFCGGAGKMSLYQKCTGSTCSNAASVGGSQPAQASASSPSSSALRIASVASVSRQSAVQTPTVTATVATTTTTSLVARGTTTTSASTSRGALPTLSTTSKTAAPSSSIASLTSSPSSSVSGLPLQWAPLGCITDTINPRTLPKLGPHTFANKLVTSVACVAYCSSNGYPFAGTEYGGECWCGNSLPANTQKLDASKCSMACHGDASQQCGGPAALTLFGNTSNPDARSWASSSKRDQVDDLKVVREHMKRHGRNHAREIVT